MNNSSGLHKKEVAFIICPIGEPMSNTRRNSEGLNSAVLKPILHEYYETVQAPLDLLRPGSITSQVIILLNSADLVIANLTELNPNVMYELAVRHAANKPVILLAEEGTKLPFDLLVERTIFYSNDMAGVEKLKPELRNAILEVVYAAEQDNPIYRALNQKLIIEITSGDDTNAIILKKIVELENIINNLANYNSNMNTPIFKERSIGEKINEYNLLNQVRTLTLSLTKGTEISVQAKDELINTLASSHWDFISEVETINKAKNEIIIKININATDLIEFEKYLSQSGYKLMVKFPGLYEANN